MNNSKKFLIVVGMVIVLALVIIAMGNDTSRTTAPTEPSQSPTAAVQSKVYKDTSATASWKEYRFTDYGFIVKYPPHFYVHTMSPDAIFISTSNKPHDPDELAAGLQITVAQGDVLQTNISQATELFDAPMLEDVVVDGMKGKALSGYGKGMIAGKYLKFIDVLHRGNTIELSYFEGDLNFTTETFEQIIATLKFVK